MGYKRKYRKRYGRRRKKRFKRTVAAIARNAVLKSIGGNRLYLREKRDTAIGNDHGEYSYHSVAAMGHIDNGTVNYGSLKDIIEDTAAQDAAAVGDADDPHRRFKIYNASMLTHFRNLSPHPVFLTVYEVCPKKHVEYNVTGAGSPYEHVLTKINDGWDEMLDATGDAYQTGPSSNNFAWKIITEMKSLTPSMSKHFTAFYKILKKKKYKLNAGDDVYWKTKLMPFTFHPNVFNPVGMTGTDRVVDMIKNYTKVIFCKVEGALGHDTSNVNIIGPMSCDLAIETSWRAKAYAINSVDDGIGARRTEDTITALEGPTEHVMTIDGS